MKPIIYLSTLLVLVVMNACKEEQSATDQLPPVESATQNSLELSAEAVSTEPTDSLDNAPREKEDVISPIVNEHQHLSQKTKLIERKSQVQKKPKNAQAIHFVDENKQIEKDIRQINSILLNNKDVKRLQSLAVQALRKHQALNEVLANSNFDRIGDADKAYQQAMNRFKAQEKAIVTKYKIIP